MLILDALSVVEGWEPVRHLQESLWPSQCGTFPDASGPGTPPRCLRCQMMEAFLCPV